MKFRRPLSAALVIGTVFVAGHLVGHFSSRSEAQVAPTTSPHRTSAQIARERLKLADEGIEVATQNFHAGVGNGADIAPWIRRRALAAVDLPDRNERITILQDCATRLTQLARHVEEAYLNGGRRQFDVQSAKFDALDVELLLAKARESQ